jgi:glucose/arabinose dehydrogenase
MRFPRRSFHSSCLAVLALVGVFLPSMLSAQAARVRTGKVVDLYKENCASCHGDQMQGASAPSMLDDIWLSGGDDDSLARSIRNGFPDRGMPAWGALIPEKEIRAMVIYMREMRARHDSGQLTFAEPKDSVTASSALHSYQVNTWLDGVNEPWSMAFLPDGGALVTEKRGRLLRFGADRKVVGRIEGLPEIDNDGQAGLFEVLLHPRYAENGWVYLAFSDLTRNQDNQKVSITRVIRGRLQGQQFVDQETIFAAKLEHYRKAGGVHFGGRLAFDRAGYLFFTIGDRSAMAEAQDNTRPNGKVHRVHDDGRIPADNPFVGQPNAVESIWSYGHRNPQGLAFHPETGQLFDLEHGPRGGDELNLVERARNYGWPVISYGMNYDGSTLTTLTAKQGMEQPVVYWVPSLGVCGMNFYSGNEFPRWQNNLFIASLAAQELRRLEVVGGKVVYQEIIFKNLGRIRHVITGPDGALYVLLPSRIARVSAAPDKVASGHGATPPTKG